MLQMIRNAIAAAIGLGAGAIVASGVFAFITILGVVPRMAQKTKTDRYIMLYEEMVIFGGLFGAFIGAIPIHIPLMALGAAIISFCGGAFYGCTAMSLAEILNIIPILTRRINLKKGLAIIVLVIALGKLIGSLIYFTFPGFLNID